MNARTRAILACCIAASLAVAIIIGLAAGRKSEGFPSGVDAPAGLSGVPAAKAVIGSGRDFGYRIADPIAISIYVREPAGVTVDPDTLLVEGDFEVLAQPQVVRHTLADGSRGWRLNLTAQSFSPAPRLSMRFTLSYRQSGNREEQELLVPPIVVHTSRTWDGRQQLKGESWSELPVTHWAATVLLVCAGLVTGVYFGSKLAKIRRQIVELDLGPDRRSVAIAQFCESVLALKRGDHDDKHYRLLCGLIRSWYKMPALPLEFVPLQTYEPADGPVTVALTAVELTLFSGRHLDASGIESLMACGGKMFFPSLDAAQARRCIEEACANYDKEVIAP